MTELQAILQGFFLRGGRFFWDEASWHQSRLFAQQLEEEDRHEAAVLLRDWLQGKDRALLEGALYLASESLAAPECGPVLIRLIKDPRLAVFAMTALGRAQYHQAIPALQKVFLGIRRNGPIFQQARAAAASLALLDLTSGTECTISSMQVDLARGLQTDDLFSSESATIAALSPLIRTHGHRGLQILLWKLEEQPDDLRRWALGALVAHLTREAEFAREDGAYSPSGVADLESMLRAVEKARGGPELLA